MKVPSARPLVKPAMELAVTQLVEHWVNDQKNTGFRFASRTGYASLCPEERQTWRAKQLTSSGGHA